MRYLFCMCGRYQSTYGPIPARGPQVGDRCCDGLMDGGFKGGTKPADGSRSNTLVVVCCVDLLVYDKPTRFEPDNHQRRRRFQTSSEWNRVWTLKLKLKTQSCSDVDLRQLHQRNEAKVAGQAGKMFGKVKTLD